MFEDDAFDAGVEGCAAAVDRREWADIPAATDSAGRWRQLGLRSQGQHLDAAIAIARVRPLELVVHRPPTSRGSPASNDMCAPVSAGFAAAALG